MNVKSSFICAVFLVGTISTASAHSSQYGDEPSYSEARSARGEYMDDGSGSIYENTITQPTHAGSFVETAIRLNGRTFILPPGQWKVAAVDKEWVNLIPKDSVFSDSMGIQIRSTKSQKKNSSTTNSCLVYTGNSSCIVKTMISSKDIPTGFGESSESELVKIGYLSFNNEGSVQYKLYFTKKALGMKNEDTIDGNENAQKAAAWMAQQKKWLDRTSSIGIEMSDDLKVNSIF